MVLVGNLGASGSQVVLVTVCFLNDNNVVFEGQLREDGDLPGRLDRVVLEKGSGAPRHDFACGFLRRPRVRSGGQHVVTPIRCQRLVCGRVL